MGSMMPIELSSISNIGPGSMSMIYLAYFRLVSDLDTVTAGISTDDLEEKINPAIPLRKKRFKLRNK